ncbi:DUF294 nucleotidyltransferase-like domain-containing protein [Caldalkalibacillus thermarum]|uniref:DUF294 nucleotidyltransferase-like domain-containing protein n=1 Tax=Caldalkalibacillus thermarum TaxID=296745 RepID=UPI001665A061|nr:DUF294 nucleotidyltransferase-like domain-containing protein [Caldalkalibacillus thermarum]
MYWKNGGRMKKCAITCSASLVRQMAAEHQVQGSTVGLWMSPNPLTITSDSYYYQALAIFLTENIKHLPVTKNGRVIGMLTLADLMRKKNRGLFDSIQAIEKAEASQLSQIKEGIYLVFASLLQDGLPAIHITDVLTTLYDRLVQHCLRLAESDLENEGLGEPPVPYCWFHMGSSGRKEQFLLTDQDHFLVYQDLEHLTKEEQEKTRQYFAQLTRAVVGYLEQAGFSRCQGGMMATNPAWRGSLSYWQQVLRKWTLHTTNTTLIKAHNFLSFRLVQGGQQLYEQFLALVKQELKRSSVFLYRMAALEREQSVPALHHPIRAFFRLAKKEIDLKKEALFPFHHALHILALSHGVYEGTPVEKIEQLVMLIHFGM